MTGRNSLAAAVAIAREKQVTVNAASLAFYAANSLIALTVLVYAAFALFGTSNLLATVLELFTGVGAAEFQRVFDQLGGNIEGRRRAMVIASLIAVWSSLRLFRAVETVFAAVYETRKERSLLRHLLDSLFAFLIVTGTVIVVASAGVVYLFRWTGLLWTALGPVVLWLFLSVLLLPVYYRFADDDDSVRAVLPGTIAAAGGWTVATVGLRIYVQAAESVDLYGVVGAALLVLTWIYIVTLSVLLGGVLNAFLTGRIEPQPEWYVFGQR